MRLLLILAVFVQVQAITAQFAVPVKEQLDFISHKLSYNNTYNGLVSYITDNPNGNPWNENKFGEQVGGILEGYVRMYETTKDKAYLIKFVNLALKAIAWRGVGYQFSIPTQEYMDGALLWPMAHFIHLILVDEPQLGTLEIPEGLIDYQSSTQAINVLPYVQIHTYAGLASWLLHRSVETLDAILYTHWSDDETFRHGNTIKGVNQESVFGATMLYLGHLSWVNSSYSGLASYLEKAARQARQFKGNEPSDRCNCTTGDPILVPSSNNSFYWYHEGWSYSRRDCLFYFCQGSSGSATNEADLSNRHEFKEDITHGVFDLQIPLLADRFELYTGGTEPFTPAELVRFRNTFTNKIAYWNSSRWSFNSAVDGTDGRVYCSSNDVNCGSGWPPDDHWEFAALGWMPLHAYDGVPGATGNSSVYQILSEHYAHRVFNNPYVIAGGLYFQGVAEVVAAQWEKECFSLSLFNRNLVYDQDFVAKAVLTVDPNGEAGASFADPVIQHPHFTVQPNISSTFRAGAAVIMEPGFEASLGSIVELTIDPLGCGLAYKSRKHEEEFPERMVVEEKFTEPVEEELNTVVEPLMESIAEGVVLSPNPAQRELGVQFTISQARRVSVKIWDGTGRAVLTQFAGLQDAGQGRIEVGVAGLARGIYSCEIMLDKTPKVYKLVLE